MVPQLKDSRASQQCHHWDRDINTHPGFRLSMQPAYLGVGGCICTSLIVQGIYMESGKHLFLHLNDGF